MRSLLFRALLLGCLFSHSVRAAEFQGAAATVHPLATRAALNTFEAGGNAIDAAVAAALTLGVVDGHNSGLGGGCFILGRLADGTFLALDGREMAPAAAARDMFIRDGKADPELSLLGPLAVGVPGELAALDQLSRKHGRISLSKHLRSAAQLAEDGFAISRTFANTVQSQAESIRQFPETAALFLHSDGSALREGEWLRQPDLARSYRAIADHGIRWFYRGSFAERAGSWMRANGGILTRSDFRRYRVVPREPLFTTYRDFTIVGFPPPSSGGVHVAQILNILEHFDLRRMGSASADMAHVVAEAMKMAFADRAFWLGDPDFADVPRALASREYAARLAARIQMEKARTVDSHDTPPPLGQGLFGKHTTHFSCADSDGNWIAITATINTSFGSKVVIPGTGIVLNNQMDDFAAQPGVPNFFGLVGADANAIEPGKRPLSSMSPTLVLRDGEPIFTTGGAGGPTIISQTVLAVVQTLDFGADPAAALGSPRLHHQWRPDELLLETGWSDDVRAELETRGHKVRPVKAIGASQAIGVTPKGLAPAADPRVWGEAGVTARSRP